MLQVVVSSVADEQEIWQFELALNGFADKKHVLEECIQNVNDMCEHMAPFVSKDISISLKAVKSAVPSPNVLALADASAGVPDWTKVFFCYKVVC